MKSNPQNIDDFLFDDEYNEFVREPSKKNTNKWEGYFDANPETKTEAANARKIIKGLLSLKDKAADHEINEFHLHQKFEETWGKYKSSKSKSTFLKASKLVWRSIAAAAVIVFAVTFYSLLHNSILKNKAPEYFEVYVPAAKQSQLTLPDGTKVWVNSDTKISYSTQFNSTERNVHLAGEAFFEVSKNEKLPFKVFANKAEIKVFGTKFNVKSYPGDEKVETVLVDGKVELSRTDSEKSGSVEMQPGDKAIFNLKTNKVTFTRKDIDADVAWKDGKVIFRNVELAEVCKTLSRRFSAEIVLSDDAGRLLTHPFTFTIENEPLPLVLDYLCKAAPLMYKTEYIDLDGEKGVELIRYTISSK